MTDPETGIVSEAEFTTGGAPRSLPQIQVFGNEFHLSGPDSERIEGFLAGLGTLLGDTVNVIRKVRADETVSFEVTTYDWEQDIYLRSGASGEPKPPNGIWLEALAGSDGQAVGWPRLFQRSRGQYVARVVREDDTALFLAQTRKALSTLQNVKLPGPTAINRPSIHVGMAVLYQQVFRAMAKIGMNFACYEYGAEVVRSHSFDHIRNIILTGSEAVPLTTMSDQMQQMFQREARQVHLGLLYPVAVGESSHSVIFLIRLYGGGMHAFLLTEDALLPPACSPAVLVVYYLEHRVERHTLKDYVHSMLHS
ncbi:hypothetical protein [Achromobacter pestifer]|nr:hypothetical protein [Achromobacter pestifer]